MGLRRCGNCTQVVSSLVAACPTCGGTGTPTKLARMTLQLRLSVLISVLLTAVLGTSALITLHNARNDVQAEVASAAGLALHMIDAELAYYRNHYAPLRIERNARRSVFNLHNLGNLRHLRIEFLDLQDRLIDSNRSPGQPAPPRAPPWFERLLGADAIAVPISRPVLFSGQAVGSLRITPDPTAEIAEIWTGMAGQLALLGGLFVLINGAVYWAVGRALAPVRHILRALVRLEQGSLATRLPTFDLPELQRIGHHFNTMADTLQQTIVDNRRLTQRIVRLQEDERKALARDLHDEIGQSLTAMAVEAAAIERTGSLADARQGGAAITTACRQTMALVHDMLHRLRPDALDQLGLPAALRDLAEQWRSRNPQIVFAASIDDDGLAELDEEVAMTLYRCAQESLTNALRHARPGFIAMRMGREAGQVELVVRDNGQGFDTHTASRGYGLAGMRERVHGLGGQVQVDSAPRAGTTVRVALPCRVEVPA